MLTKRRAALMAAAGTGLMGAVLWSTDANAAQRDAGLDSTLWVGSPTVSHVSGQVTEDAQLGLNFGVDLAGDGNVSAATNILLSVDLAHVTDLVVVTGLTAGCDAAPTLITCRLDPDSAEANYQSMTLKAAEDAPPGSNGTIVVSTTWAEDVDGSDNRATINVSVGSTPQPTQDPNAADPTQPPAGGDEDAGIGAQEVAPPVVIAPLPTVEPPTTPATADVGETVAATPAVVATPAITLTPTMSKVPHALGTRQPGFIQVGPDGSRVVSYGGPAPQGPLASPVFIVALVASSAGLFALGVFGIIGAVRANRRPRRRRPVRRPM